MCDMQGFWGVTVSQRGEIFSEPQGVENFTKDSPFRDSSQICGQADGK